MDESASAGSRVFVVCGKQAESHMLTTAFSPYGTITGVKLVRDKGVAYIKFDKASSAAKAIENMHEAVLNDGRGPLLKVFLAEAPGARWGFPGAYVGGCWYHEALTNALHKSLPHVPQSHGPVAEAHTPLAAGVMGRCASTRRF